VKLSLVSELRLGERCAVADQILHRQLVPVGPTVLEVRDRVDADGEGDFPGLRRQLLHRLGHVRREDICVPRFDDEEDVVVLGIGRLQFVEGHELGVLWAEEDAVVV
jgi:hypothetical protein